MVCVQFVIYAKAGSLRCHISRNIRITSYNVCYTKLLLDTVALTFLGGLNGKNYRKILQDENIKFSPVQVKDEMREGAILVDKEKKSVTHNIGPNFAVSKEEADEFKSKMEKMIENCDVVVFSGSSLSPVTDDIFAYGIETSYNFV